MIWLRKGNIFQSDTFLASAVVIDHRIARNRIQPRQERRIANTIAAKLLPGSKKDLGSNVFCCLFVCYAEKDDPQPQVEVALGFLMTNCAPSTFSW